MIFKTIIDETTLSGQRIVSVLQLKKIAQEKVNASIQKHIAQLELDKAALTQLEQKIASNISYEEAYKQSMTEASIAAKEHALQTKGAAGTTDTFVAKQKTVQTELEATALSSKLANVGVKALSTAFNMFAGTAVMWGISKIIEGFEYLSKSSERAKKKLYEIQTELSDNKSSYENNRKTLVGLQDEYDTLTKKAEVLGGMQNLANDKYERYKEITSQILGITPQLITGWSNEGEAISNKNNLIQTSINLLDEEYEKSLRNNTTKSKNKDVASGIIAELDEFNNSAETITMSGTIQDIMNDLEKEINRIDKKRRDIDDPDSYSILDQMYGFIYPGKKVPYNMYAGDAVGQFRAAIRKNDDYDKLAKSFMDKDNPMYRYFSDEAIDDMIRNATAYFDEHQRIIDERETLYQKYKNQLIWNAEATNDKNGDNAYKQLTDNGKAFINKYIEGLDYASIKTEDDFVEMAYDIQKSTKLLASNDAVAQLVENIFTPAKENETSAEYIERVQGAIDEIQKYCTNNYIDLPINFTTIDDVNKMTEGVKAFLKDDFDNKVDELTLEELQIAAEQIEVPEGHLLSWDELIAKIKEVQSLTPDGIPTISFSEAFNDKEFASAKAKLLDLATSGELSADTISSTEEYKKLIDQTGLSAEQLVEKIKESNIQDNSDNIQYLEGILSDIQSGKTLNLSQASELISENESLAGSIKKVGNSYTVEEEALKSLINSNIEKYNTAVSIQNEETKNAIRETKKRIKSYEMEMAAYVVKNRQIGSTFYEADNGKSGADTGAKSAIQAKIDQSKGKLEELKNSLIGLDENGEGSGNGSGSSSKMNFIEILLAKVSKATEKIQKKFEDAFSLSGAKKNFTKALSQIQKEINTNSSAYAKYMTEANKVGLDKKYITQIQNGSLQIEDNIDSTTYDKIQSYQQWYEKAQACKETIDSLRESEQSLKESYVDKITEIYDRKAKTYQNRLDTTNGLISMNEDIYGYSSTALYNKAIKDTSKNISVYRKELSTLQKEQKKVDRTTNPSLWYKYQDAIVEAKSSVDDLADSYSSLAKSKAEISITKRDFKVEKLNATKDLNDSKIDNAIGYSNKNAIVNNNINTEKSILAKYKTAKQESAALFKAEKKESSSKAFKNTLAKSGISKALITKANNAIKNGQKIPAGVLNALKKHMSGNKNAESAYKQFVEYNTALDAKDTASSDYAKQKQESKSNIKQYQQQLLDSISDDFNLRIKTVQDKQSLLDAQWDRMEAMGAEKTEQYYKNTIQNTKQETSLLQQERNALQKQLTTNGWDKNSEEYKEAESKLNDINVQIQNNTKSQIEYNNALLNMPIDKLSKALELLEAISKTNKSITEYYKTVRGYSIESDFRNQITDNLEQIEIQRGLYELYAKNAANAAASDYYAGKSYEEWMKEAQSAKASVYDLTTENENLKDSLRDEVYLKPFEDMIDYAKRVVDKIKDMESLFSTFNFTLYDDNGNLNEYGLVQMKTSFDKLSKTKTVLSNIVDELKKVDELYADPDSGMNATEYQEKRIALEDTYNSTLLESAGIMKTITDMMKEQSQQQIDSIKKQIEAYKELLSTQKEENNYQKSIKEKTDTISSLQKRLLSLGNGTTEETQAEYQKVLNELEQAKDDLEQTEWEHYIDLQTQALDDLSESLDDYLSNIDVTLESIADTLQSAKGIAADIDSSELLNKILELVGGDKAIFSGLDTSIEPKNSVTKTDSDDILSANARIREDVAKIIKENNINSSYGYMNYVTTSLGKYLDATTNSDKEKYSEELDTYLKNCINLLRQYNDNGNKETIDKINTYLIPYLKQAGINLPSFLQDGTIKLLKRNGDDGIASLKAGEAVFTSGQLELLKKSIDAMGTAIPNINDTLQNIKPISNLSGMHENSIGEVNIHLECPAATQEELYQWLQSSKTQKIIQSSVIDPIMGNGTLGRFRY